MTANRVLLFWSVVLIAGFLFYQGWNLYSPAEKWLYLFGRDARTYAASVLASARPQDVAVPESLAKTTIELHRDYVLFFPWDIELAFSLRGPPTTGAGQWRIVDHNWYVQSAP